MEEEHDRPSSESGENNKGSGLHRLNETVYHNDSPQIRGMVNRSATCWNGLLRNKGRNCHETS
ncbi:MAG: uL30 family ribosomal protein [Cloacibacillus evryensis]